jgi:hypothetical protein
MDKPTIGILSTFANFDSAYSLVSVCIDQLISLVKNGYKPVLFVLNNFQDDNKVPKGVEVRKIVPQLLLEPYKGIEYPDYWKEDVQKVKEAFEKHLTDIDFLICHDIFFIDSYLPYNIALRETIEKLPNLKQIFAWTHSAPSARPLLKDNIHANRYTLPPKTTLVYLNHDKAIDLAEMYGAWLKDVRIIHNSRDPRTCWDLDPFVVELINKYDILSADIISTIALSTPRMLNGKGLDKIVKIHSKLKEIGYKTKIIVANAHANAPRDQKMIADFYNWAAERNITNQELIFTSQERKEFLLGVPNKIVSDLFRLSNVFIFPTMSENSSLVLAEAMLAGNLLVLNKKVGTLLEHAGEQALYMDFSYRDNQEENERYYLDLAKILKSEFENNKSLQVKRKVFQAQNYDAMFKNLENLLYE